MQNVTSILLENEAKMRCNSPMENPVKLGKPLGEQQRKKTCENEKPSKTR